MKKYISIFLVGMFLATLLFLCVTDDILGNKGMKKTVNNYVKCFVQLVSMDDISSDCWNGQYLSDVYGEVLEVADEDEIIIQSYADGKPIITVKGIKFKSIIKKAQAGDKVKVTYLKAKRENNFPDKIYIGFYGEIVLLK